MSDTPRPIQGALRVHPDNPRYFADDSGEAVYLTGSHTWANLQDIGLVGVDFVATVALYTGNAVHDLKRKQSHTPCGAT